MADSLRAIPVSNGRQDSVEIVASAPEVGEQAVDNGLTSAVTG
ncbi:MAG: hypothetical protein AB2541_12145 [Candidatus Thiodiazotropha sp.]